MSNNEKNFPSEVVTINGFTELINSGWQLHVVCHKEPELRGYQWHGVWYVVAVEPETGRWRVLVTARDHARELQRQREKGRAETRSPDDYRFREIKTASGLASFIKELGFRFVGYPTSKGDSLIIPR